MSIASIVLLAFVLFFVFVIFYYVPVGLWVQSVVSLGLGRITIIDLIRMRLRKIPPRLVTDSVINSHKAGLDTITTEDLETHFLAGGNVANVVSAMIAADKAKIDLSFTIATAIDLAGRDVKTAVQTSVYPKVIDAPKEGTLAAVAKDGIEVKARARVTVRTNIPGLVGGATDETIIARVGEGIVSAIGSSETYKKVLENPDNISKAVLVKGLDAGTAYEILSIDIADVDLGKNIGARLQADQAEADLRPSGWINIGEQRIFVVSEGDYISKNDQIKVLSVDGNRVVVRKLNTIS